jgi:hypothetical protein
MAAHAARELERAVAQQQAEREPQRAGVGLVRRPAAERRLRVVLDQQLERLGQLAAVHPVGER